MISIKKIFSIILLALPLFIHACINGMNQGELIKATLIKAENKKIRRHLKSMQTVALKLVHETEQFKSLGKCKKGDTTLASHDGKNQIVTIYFNDESQCDRNYKEFIQLMQEKDGSDEEGPADSFEHNNKEDGPMDDQGQCLEKDKQSKKCCCLVH